jgi:hypothetical protein
MIAQILSSKRIHHNKKMQSKFIKICLISTAMCCIVGAAFCNTSTSEAIPKKHSQKKITTSTNEKSLLKSTQMLSLMTNVNNLLCNAKNETEVKAIFSKSFNIKKIQRRIFGRNLNEYEQEIFLSYVSLNFLLNMQDIAKDLIFISMHSQHNIVKSKTKSGSLEIMWNIQFNDGEFNVNEFSISGRGFFASLRANFKQIREKYDDGQFFLIMQKENERMASSLAQQQT